MKSKYFFRVVSLIFFGSITVLTCSYKSNTLKDDFEDRDLSQLDRAIMLQRFGIRNDTVDDIGKHLDESLIFAKEGASTPFVKKSIVNGVTRFVGRNGQVCVVGSCTITFLAGADAGHFPGMPLGRALAALEEDPCCEARDVLSPTGTTWRFEREISSDFSNGSKLIARKINN